MPTAAQANQPLVRKKTPKEPRMSTMSESQIMEKLREWFFVVLRVRVEEVIDMSL